MPAVQQQRIVDGSFVDERPRRQVSSAPRYTCNTYGSCSLLGGYLNEDPVRG